MLDAEGFTVSRQRRFGRRRVQRHFTLAEVAGFQVRQWFADEEPWMERNCGLMVRLADGREAVWFESSECGMDRMPEMTRWVRDLNEVLGRLKGVEVPELEPVLVLGHPSGYTQRTWLAEVREVPEKRPAPETLMWNVMETEDGGVTLWRQERFSFWRTAGVLLGTVMMTGLVTLIGLGFSGGGELDWPSTWDGRGMLVVWGSVLVFMVWYMYAQLYVNLGRGGEREMWEIGPTGVRQAWSRWGRTHGKTYPWADCAAVEVMGFQELDVTEKQMKAWKMHGWFGVTVWDARGQTLAYFGDLTREEAEWVRDEILRVFHKGEGRHD